MAEYDDVAVARQFGDAPRDLPHRDVHDVVEGCDCELLRLADVEHDDVAGRAPRAQVVDADLVVHPSCRALVAMRSLSGLDALA